MPRSSKGADSDSIEDIVSALRDERVLAALGTVIEAKLYEMMQTVSNLKTENARLSSEVVEVQKELITAKSKIVALEAYNRRENLIITGIPASSYSDAATGGTDRDEGANNYTLEETVLELCNKRLNVPITSADISIVHKLKSPRSQGPCPVIIRFVNRKARDLVYAARRKLRLSPQQNTNVDSLQLPPIYINEDLPKETATIFREARQLVKQKKIFRTWTSGGTVYIKHSNDDSSRPVKILSVDSLRGI